MSKTPLPASPDYIKIIACPDKYKEEHLVLLRKDIIQHLALCLAGAIKWEDIPNNIKENLLEAGYDKEVNQ